MIDLDEINDFLSTEFSQIKDDYEILEFSSDNISILNRI